MTVYVRIYIHRSMFSYMYVHMYIGVCFYMYTCIYTYICMCAAAFSSESPGESGPREEAEALGAEARRDHPGLGGTESLGLGASVA